jgi:hypothetical protein
MASAPELLGDVITLWAAEPLQQLGFVYTHH